MNGKGSTVIRGGAGLVYETVNWESMLAFNNAFGLGNVPTGAIIDAAGDTAGGTITAGNLSIPPVLPQWDSGVPIFGANVSTTTLNCFEQSLPHHERGPQPHHAVRLALDIGHAALVHAESFAGNVVRRKSRIESDRDSGHQPAARGIRAGAGPTGELTHCHRASYADRTTTAPPTALAAKKRTGPTPTSSPT